MVADSTDTTPLPYSYGMAVRSFKWSTVGGDPTLNLVVVQYGDKLYFYEDDTSIGDGAQEFTINLQLRRVSASTADDVKETYVDMAAGRGRLFVVGKHIESFQVLYNATSETIELSQVSLQERDFEGVADGVPNTTRPDTLTDAHHYNLLNSGWREEDIQGFSGVTTFPSKNMIYSLGFRRAIETGFADLDGVKEFSQDKLLAELFQDAPAPMGHFIRNPFNTEVAALPHDIGGAPYKLVTAIVLSDTTPSTTVTCTLTCPDHDLSVSDHIWLVNNEYFQATLTYVSSIDGSTVLYTFPGGALDQYNTVLTTADADTFTIAIQLPADFTEDYAIGGASGGVGQMAAADLTDTVSNPNGTISLYRPSTVAFFAGRAWYSGVHFGKLNNKVFFSQVIESDAQAGKCFQVADPTDPNISDLVDTDGGVLSLPEVSQIYKLVPHSSSILVFTDNGVWQIGPGQRGYFTATSYSVRKVSEVGTDGSGSVVIAEGIPLFWGKSSIYAIVQDPNNGFLVVQNLSINKVDNLFNGISPTYKAQVQTAYDTLLKRVVWMYYEPDSDAIEPPNTYNRLLIFDVKYQAFLKWSLPTGTDHLCSIFNIKNVETAAPRKTVKFVYVGTSSAFIADLSAVDFRDFELSEIPAYLISGYDTANSVTRYKYAPLIHVFMKKTETGFNVVDGDLVPIGESSMTMQARWDWSDNVSAGKWGPTQECYRHRRMFISGDPDSFDDGSPLVVTRNKVRGRGRSLHLKFTAGTNKDAHLLGWTTNFITLGDS
jgi:hypothetical protein